MLGVGWTEMLIIGVVALIVIGPKDLPAMMHRIGKFAGTIRRMGADFQRELNKTTGLDEVKNLRTAIAQPLKATTDAIRKEFNTTTASGAVEPSGALKPADPKVESVVSEIHKAAGMTPPAPVQTPKEAMHEAMTQAMRKQAALNAEAAAKTAAAAAPVAAAPIKAAPRKVSAAKAPEAKPAPRKLTAKKVESPAPIEAIAPAKKPAAKLAAKPMPKPAAPKAAAKAAPKAAAKAAPKAATTKPAVTRKPAAKKV